MDVPFGTDPDYTYAFTGGGLEVSAVPELADFAPLTGLALAGLGVLAPSPELNPAPRRAVDNPVHAALAPHAADS